MKVEKEHKLKIKIYFYKFVYFVCFVLFLIINIQIVIKFQNIKSTAEPVKFNKVYNKKDYSIEIYKTGVDDKNQNFPSIKFCFQGVISEIKFDKNQKNSKFKNFLERVEMMKFALKNGFEKDCAVKYSFPEIEKIIDKYYEKTLKKPKNSKIKVIENSAKTTITQSKNGSILNKFNLYSDICDDFLRLKDEYIFTIKTDDIFPEIDEKDNEKMNKIMGEFQTDFKNSSNSRKNNIKKALSKFDGMVLYPEEILSFNLITGQRNEKNGYEKAKIIKNGMFIEEFGGGVCQVSSTLYNACLLSDLEIIESHCHSLPVSYVESGFDSMVNMGSSDLVIKNNHDFPIIIATSDKNDVCLIRIFGNEKTHKIVRKHRKINEKTHFDTFFTSENEKYKMASVVDGCEFVISQGKPGYDVETWLEYYDDDILVKTKKLRKSIYNPTKRIVLVSENDERLKCKKQ